MKTLLTLITLLFPFYAMGITVKVENPWLDLDAKNSAGNSVISAHCKLTVSGIKGEDFDLVAIVKDDEGKWHTDANGNTVKTHYKCNATYDPCYWEDIEVFLRHSKLSPKVGKHSYKVYIYVYYNGEWYDGTYAGSYVLTGTNNSSSSSNSSNNYAHNHTSKRVTCSACNGTGNVMCLSCIGLGGNNVLRFLPYPPYTSYYEWVTCNGCGGSGRVCCKWCDGTGKITVTQNNDNNSYNNNYNNNSSNYYYNNNSSNYYNNNSNSNNSSSTYTTCRICGGTGVCTSCHGTGGEWRDTGYYTGSGSKSWIECPSCRGNKKCFNCHGTGRQ